MPRFTQFKKLRVSDPDIYNEQGVRIKDGDVDVLGKQDFVLVDGSVGGDAPKDVIRVYEYSKGELRINKTENWPIYIAKVGNKSYPVESVTEHLMTRIGDIFGFDMAYSNISKVEGNVCFLSRYFLKKNERLVHGAQIFSGHLEDKDFVDDVRDRRASKDIFTFDFVTNSIRNVFSEYPAAAEEICRDFVRMLAFDAITGNNDRHHANWGVIQHVRGDYAPRFSPIFDSARGLFWNYDSHTLRQRHSTKGERKGFLLGYIGGATPMTTWEGQDESLDHFELIQSVVREYPEYESVFEDHFQPKALGEFYHCLESEFGNLMCEARRRLIYDCLCGRLNRYRDALQGEYNG
jgi:hypothetical protein